MKRIALILASIIFCLTAISCAAKGKTADSDADSTQTTAESVAETEPRPEATDGLKYRLNEKKTGYVLYGLGEMINRRIISVPETYEGLPVVEVVSDTFSFGSMDEVWLPDSVTRIEQNAFIHSQVVKVVLPSGLKKIEASTFDGCKALKMIVLPQSLTTICRGAFAGCTALQTLALPASVRTIEEHAFKDCTDLRSVTFADGIGSLTMGEGVFRGCTWLRSVDFGNSAKVTKLPEKLFSQCTSLTKISLPQGIKTIGRDAFFQTCLAEIELPGTITSIAEMAFCDCTHLTTVRFNGTQTDFRAACNGNPNAPFSIWNSQESTQVSVICTDGTIVIQTERFSYD